MFGHARASYADIADLSRRVQAMERELTRAAGLAGRNISSGVSQTTDRVSDVLASALADVADRFRGGARSMGDEMSRVGHGAAREAARLGHDALRRVSNEVEQRPLVVLAIAAGLGLLVGMSSRRRH
jgi:ElaB/YqjD/DUF883 family membrane-anchored ribosome-binding protein